MRRTGASVGAFYLLAPEEDLLRLVVVGGVPVELATPWTRIPLASPIPVSDAVREDRMIWVGDQTQMVRSYPRAAVALPYQLSLAAVPVNGERQRGALLLMWSGDHPPRTTRRERSHITSSSRRLARLLDEAADAGRPVTAPDVPRILGRDDVRRPVVPPAMAAADFAERLPEGCCALDLQGRIAYISAKGAALLGGDPQALLGTLPWQALPWLDDPVYEDRYRAAVISRRPVAFTACRPPDRWLDFRLYPDASGVSVRITPAGRRHDGPAAAPDRHAPTATPARVGQLYQLLHLAAALTETVGVQDVVDLVADQITPAFGAQGLVLSSVESGRLRITGSRGYPRHVVDRLDGLPVDTPLTPAGQALSTGVPSFFGHPDEMARIYPEAPQVSGKQAWAFLPMVASGRPIGVCVLAYDRPRAFPAEERAVLTSLAGLIAQALDRARLYDAKHQLAHGLQQALLPHTLPAAPGLRVAARYLPATLGMDIGGDFYDLLRVDATTVAAVIGDVQGHNVAAAALMGQVRTAVHTHTTAGAAPEEVLARTNRLLLDLDPGLFTTCLYARIDLGRGRVRMANAGHPPPLLRCPDGRARRLDVPPGPALGVDPAAAYPVTEVDLAPGAVLVLYTDGLVETPGADIERAVDRLAEHLAVWGAEEPDRLLELLLDHAGPADRRTDDIALLLVRLEGAAAQAGPH
ncbi:SpoIIE family protein phosphatase [Streptomyces somaliensis DSM 40738]|uniref:protein-serine/threonine phosphatase n=3 Tax=Streptomyces somaliensis TaxID=78355 RepID=A0AA44DHI3_STRE0|nr:SpoIIE family protein phosphatase [Streptomyces somaliensis]MCQ0025368.1 SpoIIE family protein phosphatase [Streptomyces somaliensis DSM 40738]NKY16608.1 SpoIIE family protein phosphatase [Streptomyces somaliensis DSM 40738]